MEPGKMSGAQHRKGDDLGAKLFRDREHPGDWRVEKFQDGGESIDVALFSGGDSKERAIRYAEREYGGCEEIELHPYRRGPGLGQILDDLSRSGISVSIEVMPEGAGYLYYFGSVERSAESIYDLA